MTRSNRGWRRPGYVLGVVAVLAIGALSNAAVSQGVVGTLTVQITPPSGGAAVAGGSDFSVGVQVTNTGGPDLPTGYTLTLNSLPSGVTLSGSDTNCTSPGGDPTTINCNRPALGQTDPPDSFAVLLTAAHNAAGTSAIGFSTSSSDGGFTSTTGSQDITVETRADLGVVLSGVPSASQVAGLDSFVATATVTNYGASDSGTWQAKVTLPGSDLSFGTLPSDCSPSGLVVTCDGSNLDPTSASLDHASFALPVNVLHGASVGDHVVQAEVVPTRPESAPDTTHPDTDSATVHVIARADLALVVSTTHPVAVTPPYVAGDAVNGAFSYVYTVTNNGPSDHNGSYSVTDHLPAGFVFQSGTGCSATGMPALGQTVVCTAADERDPQKTHVFTVGVKVDHSVIDGSHDDQASVATGGSATPEPSGTSFNNDGDAIVDVVTVANLEATSMTVSSTGCTVVPASPPCLLANGVSTATLSFTFTNTGPSDAQGATFEVPSTLVEQSVSALLPLPITPGTSRTVSIVVKADPCLGHQYSPTCLGTRVSGPIAVNQTASAVVQSPTGDPNSDNNSITATHAYLNIHTAPSPPQNLFVIPGNGQPATPISALLTWEQPAQEGGQSITSYQIKVTPTGGGSTQTFNLPLPATTGACGNIGANDCYRYSISGLNNDLLGGYTFKVSALNAAGTGDPAKFVATPSVNAVATAVPTGTSTTLTTCTTATLDHPTCVQYIVPSGNGGVFGVQGHVDLTSFVCGTFGSCISTTGAQNLGALAGYDQPSKPLVMIIRWDSSTIPTTLSKKPACGTGSGTTATNCYPNNLPIFYETSAFLAAHDSRGANYLNAPGLAHFCSLPILRGGAGNVNFARPTPIGGYTDTAGSACIKQISVLTGIPGRAADKGDIQVQINLTSDSDALAGHH